jgi:hypothetical protein
MKTSALRSIVVAILLLCVTPSLDAAAQPRRVNGAIEPDVEVQAALKRLVSDDAGLTLKVVHDLAKLTGAAKPGNEDARRHLAEQFFLYAVGEKWAVEAYELFVMKNAMRILQGTLFVSGSDFVIAAAPNIGHEDRTVRETAERLLSFHDAFTPVKGDSGNPTEYHFRQLEPFLEHVQKLQLAPAEAGSRVVLGMYRADPEAALNTMVRMTRRAAKIDEQRRALPDLREEREWVARVRFVTTVGPESDAAASMKPGAGECLEKLAASPHWYVRSYVPFVFLQEERLLDRGLLERLADDSDGIVREAVRNVRDELRRREAERRKAEEAFGRK